MLLSSYLFQQHKDGSIMKTVIIVIHHINRSKENNG